MPDSYLVRASRDGDQFHYLWAARRCLPLLSPHLGLVALTIEGASPEESRNAEDQVAVNDEIIDIAEYYGSEQLEASTLVRYMQLKHSTLHANEPWSLSGMEKTLAGFAEKYRSVRSHLKLDDLAGKCEFWFVTNRRVSEKVHKLIQSTANGVKPNRKEDLEKLKNITAIKGDDLARFARLMRIDDKQNAYWEQRNLLHQDITGYLADDDTDAPIRLKDFVGRKASSEFKDNPTITKYDLLRVLRTDIHELFPANNLIAKLPTAVPREQESQIFAEIVGAESKPVILHADGGMGKSVLATRIELGMPPGSATILYDCFGSGQYRNASRYRHRHKDALVQLANELAVKGLCHPLIPTSRADHTGYMRAFQHRIQQAVTSIRAESAGALLCLVVDAGDNAQIAAEEVGEKRSFIRDLLREPLPSGIRLVVLCRTHRQEMLDPPAEAIRLELRPFSRTETARLLLQSFSSASESDIDEFHRLSSQNPRVQMLALSRGGSLQEILRMLGPNPTTVDDTIGHILSASITKLRDALPQIEKTQIDKICAGLAALRPLIPIPVLSALANVPQAAIRSFATDLGRPLIVTENTIQFYDEPAETWFREQFKPQQSAQDNFVAILRPLASTSVYVAAVLPQLMLEAGQFAALVELALSSEALPSANPLERRDIDLQRLQFALKASLRSKRYLDASKLALRAGGEAAGDSRQRSLLQENTDLAALFLGHATIEEIVSRRSFGSGWVGSHHAYEAGLMSGIPDLIGEARSRLRMALEWLSNWSRQPDESREKERITDEDIAEIAYAHLNIHGPRRCAYSMRGWSPKDVTYRVCKLVVERMVQHSRFDEIDKLALAAESDLCLILAITRKLGAVGRHPPKDVVVRAYRLLSNTRVQLPESHHWAAEEHPLVAVTSIVEAALGLSVCSSGDALALLDRYLPKEIPRDISSRYSGNRNLYLRVYALRAALSGTALTIRDLAHPDIHEKLERNKGYNDNQEAREFKENIGSLLPWHILCTRARIGTVTPIDVANSIKAAMEESGKARPNYYREERNTTDEVARLWIDILSLTNTLDEDHLKEFNAWRSSLKSKLFTPTLLHITEALAMVPALHSSALDIARGAFEITRNERDSADSKASDYLKIARAVLPISKEEARAYFNQAVEVANKIGDENIDRWSAIIDLADRAAKKGRPAPQAAYNFSRCAELTYAHVARDKHFMWDQTVRALGGLCGSSSLAILSRWRDRHFGREERILPELVESLVIRRELSPLDALVLQGVRAEWDGPSLLETALKNGLGKIAKADAALYLYRYMSFGRHNSKTWSKLNDICSQQGISLPDIETRIDIEERREKSIDACRAESESWRKQPEAPQPWDSIFDRINLASADDIWTAYLRFRAGNPPFDQGVFFAEATRRLPAGRRADFIRAFADVAEFDLYHLRNLFSQIPTNWQENLSVRPALADTLISFARRYCLDISINSYYQILPFPLACELSGVPEKQLVATILSAIGEKPDVIGSGRLFSLVGLLAVMLSEDEALEGLGYSLSLFDPILDERDGDGPWKSEFAPIGDISKSVAGYIWAGLGAPDSAVRWEASHCVLAASRLKRQGVLHGLVELAKAKTGAPFVDFTLPFYELHAQLWLMIGFARSAREYPVTLAPFFGFIVEAALGDHVLLRAYASRAALFMIEAGAAKVDEELAIKLRNVNVSPFAILQGDEHNRQYEVDNTGIDGDDKYYFGIDLGPYWFAPLGSVFGVSQARVERSAIKIIREDWQHTGASRWDEDERARRGYYRDMETYASHGSYPMVHGHRLYLAFHSMMLVAAQLLATRQVTRSTYEDQDGFCSWLERHTLSRTDGYWLADRRDVHPLECPGWKDENDVPEWPWSLQRSDFDEVLSPVKGTYSLWGYWTNVDDRREEHIRVASALVSPGRSQSLLRALQSVRNSHDFYIPPAGDDQEIDQGEYQLKGWVTTHTRDRELDAFDPWSGSISYPPPRPAKFIRQLLGLTADVHRREWRIGVDGPIATSATWGQQKERREEVELERGTRLQGSSAFVVELLKKTGMNLIVEVEISRRHARRSYDSSNKHDGGLEYPLRSVRHFIIDAEARYVSV